MKHLELQEKAEKALRSLQGMPPPDRLREASARRRFMEQASRLRRGVAPSARPAHTAAVILLRAGITACLVVIGLSAFTGIASAANRAVPGDLLYPLDLSIEELTLSITILPQNKVALLLSFASERLDEAQELNLPNSSGQEEVALAAYERLITQLIEVIDSAGAEDQPAMIDMSEELLSEHQQHLLDIRQDAPEKAFPGLDRAIDAAQHGKDEIEHKEKSEKTPGPTRENPDPHPTKTPRAPHGSSENTHPTRTEKP